MKRAFSYLRFSDPTQAGGDSKRRQREWGKAVCQQRGWFLDDSLRLEDLGVSAFRGKNADVGALAAFREAIQVGKVLPGDILLIESLDRLSRQELDPAQELFKAILRAGVDIYTREPERHYTKKSLNDVFSVLEAIFVLSRAHEESAIKSMRALEGWKERRTLACKERRPMFQKERGRTVPAWLRVVGGRFEPIPEAVKAIRYIYRLAAEGLGIKPICTRLHRELVPPIARADHWTNPYVSKLLRDRTVLGEFQPRMRQGGKHVPAGEPIPDYYPAIIEEAEWYRVRQAVKGRGRQAGPAGNELANLFTGLLFDARDGRTMHLGRANWSGSGRVVLVSSGCREGLPESQRLHFPYQAVEGAFLTLVSELKASDVLGGAVDTREEEIAALSGKLQELAHKIDTVQQRALSDDNMDPLLTLLERLGAQKKQTAARLDKLKAERSHRQPEALGETQSLIGLLAQAEGDERLALRRRIKARIRQLVESVWVLVWDHGHVREAAVQVWFHGQGTGGQPMRGYSVFWARAGKHRGKCWRSGSRRLEADFIKGSSALGTIIIDLRLYRTVREVREVWDGSILDEPPPPPGD